MRTRPSTTRRFGRTWRGARGSVSARASAFARPLSSISRPLREERLRMWRSVMRTVALRGATRARRSTRSTNAASLPLS